ncbi:hypothetical protein OPT61_g5720 [Boeremia exigua]|uniref:Uncharacterized protein n=1 Tax=Boeremia exigua TaxID=749465 RepID=A0ACC2I9J3_9PLEO|nr:hypothetical protein OPT61_g5720 [Boeremia exigua]
MFSATASTTIASDAQTIWETLMNTEDWPKWNTFVTLIEVRPPHRQLQIGSRQTIQITPDLSSPLQTESYTNIVTELREKEEFVWEGILLWSLIFKTVHWCRLEAIVPNEEETMPKTRFTQGETFFGLLAPVVWLSGKLDVLTKGYERMNEDLKSYIEQ